MITYDFDDTERVIICTTCGLFLCDHDWTHWGMVPVGEAWLYFDLPSESHLREGNFFGSTYTGGLASVFFASKALQRYTRTDEFANETISFDANLSTELLSPEIMNPAPAVIDELTRDLGGECHANVNLLWLCGFFDGIVRATEQQLAARYTYPTGSKDSRRGQWRVIDRRVLLAVEAYGTPEYPSHGRDWLKVRLEYCKSQDRMQHEPEIMTNFLVPPADFVAPDLDVLLRKLGEPNPWTRTNLLETPFDPVLHNMWTLSGELMHRATGALNISD